MRTFLLELHGETQQMQRFPGPRPSRFSQRGRSFGRGPKEFGARYDRTLALSHWHPGMIHSAASYICTRVYVLQLFDCVWDSVFIMLLIFIMIRFRMNIYIYI